MTVSAALARQSDYADNPLSYDAVYYSVQGVLTTGAFTFTGAYEVLGSDDGNAGFRTPVATLHKFQGWTDRFLATPAAGVRDTWFSVGGKVGNATITGVFHAFGADEGGRGRGGLRFRGRTRHHLPSARQRVIPVQDGELLGR